MRMIVMMLGLFLAMVQMANAAPQTKAEALLEITKLIRCSDAHFNGLRNFSTKASPRQRMEKVLKRFEILCNMTPRNPEEARSLDEKITQHNNGERYKLVSRTYRSSNLNEKIHMQEAFSCIPKNTKQQNLLQRAKKIALGFANASETRSIEKASKRLQKRWNKLCATPRDTQAGKRKFINRLTSFWEAARKYRRVLHSTLAS